MKNILSYLLFGISFVAAGCQDDKVETPTFDVTVENATCEVGEEVKFHFSGYADFVTIFTGIDNFTAGNVEGTFKGSRYVYRERISEPGVSILSFNTKKDNAKTLDNGQLSLLISADFNGGITMKDIEAAAWTDISDRAKWPLATTAAGTNVASGNIDLSEWNGKLIYVALRFKAGAGTDQFGWTLSSFTLKNTVPTDALPYTLWTNGAAPKFGTMTNLLQEDGISAQYAWTVGTSLTCKGGSGTGTQDLTSWLISSPINPARVDPDFGTRIKSYSEAVPDLYSFKYFKPGTYTATVVARNANANGNRETVKNIEITVKAAE